MRAREEKVDVLGWNKSIGPTPVVVCGAALFSVWMCHVEASSCNNILHNQFEPLHSRGHGIVAFWHIETIVRGYESSVWGAFRPYQNMFCTKTGGYGNTLLSDWLYPGVTSSWKVIYHNKFYPLNSRRRGIMAFWNIKMRVKDSERYFQGKVLTMPAYWLYRSVTMDLVKY